MADRLGLSGRLAAVFQDHPLTPVIALVVLIAGVLAAAWTPREEEPQIDVTMANVIVAVPGASARDVEQLVATPLERRLAGIPGVDHVYADCRPGQALLTVVFDVGVARDVASVRLYERVYGAADAWPRDTGAGTPLIRVKGIDDVPVMSLVVWTDDPARDAIDLAAVARSLASALQRVPGTRDVTVIGAPERVVSVRLAPDRLAAHDLTIGELGAALAAADVVRHAGERTGRDGAVPTTAGTFLADARDVADLVIGMRDGRPVRVADVATIADGADIATTAAWHGAPPGRDGPAAGTAPAVTLAIAKLPGSNAADVTAAVAARVAQLQGEVVPAGVHVTTTRDYGRTAADKASTLIHKLVFATLSVVLLVLVALGAREAAVVGAAVALTLAAMLFASWAMGFTLNRVSLFALIFAIGILVDDAIVVVENIHRHGTRPGASLRGIIPAAVDEVGGPTILATFTVVAALLPMAFVSGLMGPYMRPIPINASVGMVLSLAIALTVTPWLAARLLDRPLPSAPTHDRGDRLHRLFDRVLRPFFDPVRGVARRRWLFGAAAATVVVAVSLAALQWVVLKMLPFDNKSELQVVVDLPEGRPLEATRALLVELSAAVDAIPEVSDYQGYAGTSAPINFNGLVRQYDLRRGGNVGDLQVNLVDRRQRDRQSHAVALAMRPALAAIARRHGAALTVVEVPPGPPVQAPIVAEVQGPDYARVRRLAVALQRRFDATPGVVDTDTSVEHAAVRETFAIDRVRAAHLGVPLPSIVDALAGAIGGLDAAWLRDGRSTVPRPVRLRLPAAEQATAARVLALDVRAADGQRVPLGELVRVEQSPWDGAIHHKDLQPVAYVTGDVAGGVDSPLYAMFDLAGQLRREPVDGVRVGQAFVDAPVDTSGFAVKWDGEWRITYETFRDMGIAYAAGIVLIYLLLVAQFRDFVVPFVVMAPIPLTVVGVMPGHALLGAPFTATSMIGMIALAGIIVRNSILLVDFAAQAIAAGREPGDALVAACAERARPIALTGAAAMLGAAFILDDPIFNGLAVSLVFGILASTVLTLVVIPLLYRGLVAARAGRVRST